MANRDSIQNTIIVTVLLCLVCSIAVSGTAVLLRDRQEANKQADFRRNILIAAELVGRDDDLSRDDINSLFESRIDIRAVNFETGEEWTDQVDNLDVYNQIEAAARPQESIDLPGKEDIAGINRRENIGLVYVVKAEGSGKIEKYVLPIRGYGLWSTMKGFVALSNDTQTIKGITFYSHAETPGLGGEIENPRWQDQFRDRIAIDPEADGEVKIEVVKRVTAPEYQVDALSGATITSAGVSNTLKYWLGSKAYGPYLAEQRAKTGQPAEDPDGEPVSEAVEPETDAG